MAKLLFVMAEAVYRTPREGTGHQKGARRLALRGAEPAVAAVPVERPLKALTQASTPREGRAAPSAPGRSGAVLDQRGGDRPG